MEHETETQMGLYVVIADDEWLDHELIKKAIRQCNLSNVTTSVFNGEQLLNLLLKKGFHKSEAPKLPDFIFLDLKMGIMDGFTALKKIKADDNLKNIPVFILSVSSSE